MLKSDTSSRDSCGNRHTYDRARQLRAGLEPLARGCLIWPDASFLQRQCCTRVRATNTRAVSWALTAAGVHQPNHLDRLPRRGSPTLPSVRSRGPRPASTVTFETGTRYREFFESSLTRTDAQSRAQLESPRARVPYIAGGEFSASPLLRTAALRSKPTRPLAAYGAANLTTKRRVQQKPVTRTLPTATSSLRSKKTPDSSRCRCSICDPTATQTSRLRQRLHVNK